MTTHVLMVWDDAFAKHEVETDDICEVMQRVEALDGQAKTLVTVFRGDAHAAVGGDAGTGLVLYVTFDGTSFHQLAASESGPGDEAIVVVGGQAGRYSRHVVVEPEAAEAALRAFIHDGMLDPSQRWETS